MSQLLEFLNIHPAFIPVDLQDGANTGDWFSMENYDKVIVLFISSVGTDAQDPTISLQQATVAAGTDSKALAIIDRVYSKQAASNLNSTGTYTILTQTAAQTFTTADSAQEVTQWAVEIDADQLDVDNGFKFIQLTVADVGGNAQIGAAFYIGAEPRKPQSGTVDPLS